MWRWDLSVSVEYTRSIILIRSKGIVLVPSSSNNELFMWVVREREYSFSKEKTSRAKPVLKMHIRLVICICRVSSTKGEKETSI